jgi:hypothetical protein
LNEIFSGDQIKGEQRKKKRDLQGKGGRKDRREGKRE